MNSVRGNERSMSGISDSKRGLDQDFNMPHTHELKEKLGGAATDLRSAAEHAVPAAREQVNRVGENAAAQAKSIEDSLASCVRDKPLKSLLVAAGVGVFAGLFLLRR